MRIIALEGVNAAGKSSAARQVCSSLEAAGRPCFSVDPSGIGPIGKSLRNTIVRPSFQVTPEIDAILFTALRADGAQNVLDFIRSEPAATIVLERWSLALAAYGTADGVRSELITEMRKVLGESLHIDLTILLDIDGKLAFKRSINMPDRNRFELKGYEYFDLVAHWYRTFAREEENTVVIDASQSQDITLAQLMELL